MYLIGLVMEQIDLLCYDYVIVIEQLTNFVVFWLWNKSSLSTILWHCKHSL